MPTLSVYDLKDKQMADEYDKYLNKTKIPVVRGAPWSTAIHTWRIDTVLAAAVSGPEGELPSEPPYMYFTKIEVSDLDAMVSFLGTDARAQTRSTKFPTRIATHSRIAMISLLTLIFLRARANHQVE